MPKKRKTPSHASLLAAGKLAHKSKVKNPVQAAWESFERSRKDHGFVKRKLFIDEALARGLAFYTARTQFQEWKKAGDRDRANQASNNAKLTALGHVTRS